MEAKKWNRGRRRVPGSAQALQRKCMVDAHPGSDVSLNVLLKGADLSGSDESCSPSALQTAHMHKGVLTWQPAVAQLGPWS